MGKLYETICILEAVELVHENYKDELYRKLRNVCIYVIYKNMSQVEYLVNMFNSELGKLYETTCIPEAVELVHEHYRDERTIQKIHKCLNVSNKEFDFKQIAKKIEEYRKIINKHARKIFRNLKDGRYP